MISVFVLKFILSLFIFIIIFLNGKAENSKMSTSELRQRIYSQDEPENASENPYWRPRI